MFDTTQPERRVVEREGETFNVWNRDIPVYGTAQAEDMAHKRYEEAKHMHHKFMDNPPPDA